jgi:hypothetical protein
VSNLYIATLQSTYTENSKQLFPEKELHGPSPNFHIHVPVSDLYIPTFDLPILLQKYADQSWENIIGSQTHEYGNWDCGRAIPRKGIHKWDFRCSAWSVRNAIGQTDHGNI